MPWHFEYSASEPNPVQEEDVFELDPIPVEEVPNEPSHEEEVQNEPSPVEEVPNEPTPVEEVDIEPTPAQEVQLGPVPVEVISVAPVAGGPEVTREPMMYAPVPVPGMTGPEAGDAVIEMGTGPEEEEEDEEVTCYTYRHGHLLSPILSNDECRRRNGQPADIYMYLTLCSCCRYFPVVS
jgi:hypothetical protein